MGLPALCKLLGFVFANKRSMLAFELTLLRELRELVGLGASISFVPSLAGDADNGLEENPKGAVRRFFCNMLGAVSEDGSSIGVNGDKGARNMLKLFLRRLSDMFTHHRIRTPRYSRLCTMIL